MLPARAQTGGILPPKEEEFRALGFMERNADGGSGSGGGEAGQ